MAAERKVTEDLAYHLAVDVSSLEVGTNLFRGPTRPHTRTSAGTELIPRDAVFINMPTAGPEPYPLAGSGWGQLRTAAVQVVVRDTDVGSDVPQAVFDALVDMTLGTGYLGLEMVGSGPAYLPGIDPNQDSTWSINVNVLYDQRLTPEGDGELDFSDPEDSGWLYILYKFGP